MTWNDQILSLLENGKGKEINFTISVWTRARSPLFTSNLNSLLLTNRATWENLEKVYNDAKSVFQRRFHGRCLCPIVKSLMKTEGVKFLCMIEIGEESIETNGKFNDSSVGLSLSRIAAMISLGAVKENWQKCGGGKEMWWCRSRKEK